MKLLLVEHKSDFLPNSRISLWLSGFLCFIFLGLLASSVRAQVSADETLPQPSVVNSIGNRFTLTGGTRSGANLFHSFREFSVPQEGTASFQQVDPAIANIITRVTGSSISRIDGLIEALQPNGTVSFANLFLINPNGFLFGKNASLNIGGSFLATTANRLNFADGTEFRADGSQNAPLLTVSIPSGLQFGQNAGRISHQSRNNLLVDRNSGEVLRGGLEVLPGRTLALIGGHLDLSGGVLFARAGHVELGSIGANNLPSAQVSLTPADTGWRFRYNSIQNFQDIELADRANVSTSGVRGGSIHLQARRIDMIGTSYISSFTSGDRSGRAIDIRANQLNIRNASRIRTLSSGTGAGGNIIVNVEQLNAQSGGQLTTNVSSSGDGGNIWVVAGESVTLNGTFLSPINDVDHTAVSTGFGQISNAPSSGISDTSSGVSDKPNIIINHSDVVGTGLYSQVVRGATGNGGRLVIRTSNLVLQDGAQVNTVTSGLGNAGDIQIQANSIYLSGVARNDINEVVERDNRPYPSGLFTGSRRRTISQQELPRGNGGLLRIDADNLVIRDGAAIKTNTEGRGDSGDLEINVSDRIEVIGRVLDDTSDPLPSFILTASGGVPGIDNSGIGNATGRSGSARIQTRELRVEDGGTIAVSSNNRQSPGAGQMRIQAQTIRLNEGTLNAQTESGSQANINLQGVNLLLLDRNSNITTSAGIEQGRGTGGNVNIRGAGFIIANPSGDSDITANAVEESAGNINIDMRGIIGLEARSQNTSRSDITANSRNNADGEINLNQVETDPTRGLLELPEILRDVSQEPNQLCIPPSDGEQDNSYFVTSGRGGLPTNPYETLRSPTHTASDWLVINPQAEGVVNDQRSENRSEITEMTSNGSMVEASGWVRSQDGTVRLVAQLHEGRSPLPSLLYQGCPRS
jgi:filamentous hemagglutinin family protein